MAPLRRRANWCKSVHHVEIPSNPDLKVSPVYLKKNILEAVRSLFGEEGAKSPVDILKLSPEKRRFVLRCPRNSYVRLRASLTLSRKYSPNLLSFTADSRTFQHGEVPLDSSPCH
ncbi:PREDICTED: ribonuclease P protein subunit p14 isoform X2 [Acromyrmex echinatior]|uniref:ribonuclease P protein subunit p14 isoform X2 n=1 Tax=Acromyrmex echinatior TaxID=103372 RepID=UPI000580C4FF|nr:PREDICTED: ribonuclease P protein subunit p14 isoform X2 [Acromyrmex echinatior]